MGAHRPLARSGPRRGRPLIALLHGPRVYGAVERYVEGLARALGDRCVLVHPGIEQFERLGVPTVVVEDPTTRRLTRIIRALRPRVAHATDMWPQALVAARLARTPRVLVTHHTPELPRRDNLAGRLWLDLAWALRPEVIYTSEADREHDGRRPSHVVPLGIDLDRFAAGSPALAGDGPVVGAVGRLAPQKDHATLLEAARLVRARRPDIRFAIVGDGELRGDLERRTEELGLADAVLFTGPRDDVPDLLASFSVFAHPSLYEGLCLAVIEAQAAGVPVVATPVGGVAETVVDGETGLLVQPRDSQALAAAILRLLDDQELARRLTTEAKRRVGERFSSRQMVEGTLSIYAGERA